MVKDYEPVRHEHYFRGNAGCSLPQHLIFLDSETLPYANPKGPEKTDHKLRLWCATYVKLKDGKETRTADASGTTPGELWDWIDNFLNNRYETWLFAHNLGFDATVCGLWTALKDKRYVTEWKHEYKSRKTGLDTATTWRGCLSVSGGPTIVEVRRPCDGAKLILVDTLNYFRCSLSEIGESIGIPKLTMPAFTASDDDWRTYCWTDVLIIKKAILYLMDLVKRHEWGNWRYTISGQAMAAFRHKYLKTKLLVHGHADILKLERDAYYGGQCSLFYLGTPPCRVHVLDRVAFYPSVMRDTLMPTVLRSWAQMISPLKLWEWCASYFCIARVEIDSEKETFPVREHGRLLMARGRFITTLCGPELERALRIGAVRSVGLAARYEQENIFKEFVDDLWTLRLAYVASGQHQFEYLVKQIMNSVAGKFGQHGTEWTDDPLVESDQAFALWHNVCPFDGLDYIYRSFAYRVQRKTKDEEHANSIISIAAAITAYGREEMLRLRTIAGHSNCYYQDTDSLHVNNRGYKRLNYTGEIGTHEIGKLQVKQMADKAEYRGIKYYALDDKWTIAGLKPSAVKIGDEEWTQEEFQGIWSVIQSGNLETVQVTKTTVRRPARAVGGNIGEDGWITPYVF